MGAIRKSQLSKSKQDRLNEHFVAGATARCVADLVRVNPKTAIYYFHRLREIIAYQLEQEADAVFSGEIEVDESYFGGKRKGQRGRGAVGKVPVFGLWSQKWLDHEYTEEHLDPSLLMWDNRRNVDCRFMPDDKRVMVEFKLHGYKSKQKSWWLMFEDSEADLCNKDPGYEIDLYVKAHIRDLTEVWVSRRRLNEAVRDGSLKLERVLRQVRNFPKWFSLSMYAPTVPQTNSLAAARPLNA